MGTVTQEVEVGPTVEKLDTISTQAAIGAGSGTTVYGVLTANEWALAVGIVGTVMSVGLNWYFKRKHLEIARKRLQLEEAWRRQRTKAAAGELLAEWARDEELREELRQAGVRIDDPRRGEAAKDGRQVEESHSDRS